MEEIARLSLRGFEVQCFRIPGDPENTLRMNFPILPDTPASKFHTAMGNRISEVDAMRFLSDARYMESDVSFQIAWSDYA